MTTDHRIFHLPPPWPEAGGEAVLSPEESRHALRALRLRVGDRLRVVDGRGRLADATACGVERQRLRIRLEETRELKGEGGGPGNLALPWIRSPARLDWAVEKATELGAGGIFLFAADRGVRDPGKASDRRARWTRVAIAAMKQCGRARCPQIALFASLDPLLESQPASRLLLADPAGARTPPGAGAADQQAPDLLIVGPEGGWSDREARLLELRSPHRIALGPFRLRTETAAVALCTLVSAMARD